MEQLIEKMQQLLATSFTMYLKTHTFHWNVEGQDFHQYHAFLGTLYEELHDSIDTTAEEIRALNVYVKASLTDFKEMSVVVDQLSVVTDIQQMNQILIRDNDNVLAVLNEAHKIASDQQQYGLINYIEGRMDIHKKHGWMLRASRSKSSMPIQPSSPIVAGPRAEETEQPTEQMLEESVKVYPLTFN